MPPTRAPALAGAQPLREVLAVTTLAGAEVLAGHAGLDREVERLNVMEVPDIAPWVKPREFLLTTAYPLRGRPDTLPGLITDLDDAGVAGIGVKLGRYLDELPQEMLEVADRRGFPVVRLPDGVSFDDIFHQVLGGILNRQAGLLARSERTHRAFLQLVLRGQGLPEIARELADLIDAAAAIVDPTGRLLAHAGLDRLGIDPAPETLTVDLDAGTATVGTRDLACIGATISAGPRAHGHVVALAEVGHVTDDVPTLENAATVCALAITKQLEVQAVEDKYRSDLMHDLLRHVDDRDDVLRRASGFGWDLDRRLICMVVRMDRPPALVIPDEVTRRPPLATAMRQPVVVRDPHAAVVRFSHEVVIVTAAFDAPSGRAEARQFAASLVDAADALATPVSVGLSRPVTDVTQIATAYEQASRALTIGRRIHGGGALVHFDDLGAYRLLSLVEDHAELRAFAEEVLGELAGDDRTSVDLRRTLEVLLETGGNVAEAARRLHFHYNTLRYRVDKLESIVGPFTTDPRIHLDVQLALLVLSMRGLDEAV